MEKGREGDFGRRDLERESGAERSGAERSGAEQRAIIACPIPSAAIVYLNNMRPSLRSLRSGGGERNFPRAWHGRRGAGAGGARRIRREKIVNGRIRSPVRGKSWSE